MKKLMLCLASMLAQAAIMAPAHAQLSVEGTLPTVVFTDSNGVDLRSGQILRSSAELTIGAKDAPTLSYQLYSTFQGAMSSSPLILRIEKMYCPPGTGVATGCFEELYATVGTVSYYFGYDGSYPRLSPSGAKLEQTSTGYLMTDSGGTKYVFDNFVPDYSGGVPARLVVGRVRDIIRQNGEKQTYAYFGTGYGTVRSITSNTGYQLHIEGSVNSPPAYLINLAVDYCDPNAATCTLTRNWPKLSVSGDGIVDQIGRLYTVSGGSDGFTVTSPGGGMNYRFKRKSFQDFAPAYGAPATNIIGTEWYEDSDGRTTYTYSVDKHARVIASSSTRPSGAVTRFSIDGANSNSTTQTSPSPYTFGLTDPINRKTIVDVYKTTIVNGGFWPLEFDTKTITYPESNQIAIGRDGRNRLTGVSATPKPNTVSGGLSSSASYSDCTDWSLCTRPNYTVDARGNQTDYTYYAATGLIETKTAPADANGVRPRTRYYYRQVQAVYKNAAGQLAASGSPVWKLDYTTTCKTATECAGSVNETRVTYGYDGNLLPTTETTSAGDGSVSSTVTKAYDAVGNLISVDGPLAGTADVTRYFYDDARQLKGEIGPDPDGTGALPNLAVRYSYDLDGLPTLVEKGTASGQSDTALAQMSVSEQVASVYGNGRKVKESRSSGNTTYAVTQYSYDSDGRPLCTAVRMNSAAFGSLPADACALGTQGTQGADRITKNVYDLAGQLLQVRKAVGTSIEQAYATYAYSANGKRSDVIDANGNRAQLVYDGYDRQSRWSFPGATRPTGYNPSTQANALSTAGAVSTGDYEAYGYDNNGNRTSLRKRDGRTLTFDYDALNRMTRKVVPDGCAPTQVGACPAASATRDVYYGYDLRGLQSYARFDAANGDGVTSDYDALGRLTTSLTAMGGYSRTLAYQYDAAGNRTRITFPDGEWVNSSYDGLNRFWHNALSGFDPVVHAEYDAAGRRSMLYRLLGSNWDLPTTYGYDGISRLSTLSHAFADSGAAVSNSYDYNPASQITSVSRNNDRYAFTGYKTASLTYTPNGLNQYGKVESTAGSNTYQYDANGNLVSDGTPTTYGYDAENRLVTTSGGVVLTYDPLGRLWQTAGGTPGTTQFLYDGDQLTAEYNASGTMLRRYLHGPDDDDPLAWFEGGNLSAGARRYYHADHQGSIVGVSDINGALVAINTYDPYGVPGSGNAGRFQYTGQAWLPELGMYHYKARIYSPKLGRFMQTDPIGYDDQINLYAYVGNDPVNGRDPDGMQLSRIPDDISELWRDFKEDPVGTVLDVVSSLEPNPVTAVATEIGAVRGVTAETSATIKVEKTYQTYTKVNSETKQVYTGRTSGAGTPAQNVARRDSNGYPSKNYGPAKLDKSSSNREAIRGREQQMIEKNGGAQSKGGSSGNKINGISDKNPKGAACKAAANKEFGPC